MTRRRARPIKEWTQDELYRKLRANAYAIESYAHGDNAQMTRDTLKRQLRSFFILSKEWKRRRLLPYDELTIKFRERGGELVYNEEKMEHIIAELVDLIHKKIVQDRRLIDSSPLLKKIGREFDAEWNRRSGIQLETVARRETARVTKKPGRRAR